MDAPSPYSLGTVFAHECSSHRTLETNGMDAPARLLWNTRQIVVWATPFSNGIMVLGMDVLVTVADSRVLEI